MNAQDVVNAGDFSFWENIENFLTSFSFTGADSYFLALFFLMIYFIVAFFLGVAVCYPLTMLVGYIMEKKGKPIDLDDHTGKILVLFLLFGSIGNLFVLQVSTPYEGKPYQEWKEKHVIPYVNQLPEVKKDVQSIQVLDETQTVSTFFEQTTKKPLDASVVYTDKEGVAKKTKVEAIIHYTLAEGETPYFTSHYLSSSLGNDFKKGFYNVHVYLPKNYTLNYQ